MILFNNKKLMLLTSIFTIFSYTAQAQYLTAKQIYSFAKSHNYRALSHLGGYVDTQDSNGYTPLCMAIANNDTQTYNILRQYGANPQPACLQSALAASKSATFLGMGAMGWSVVGALAVGGGIAAAAAGGGGGGGSSSGSNSSNNNSSIPDIQPSNDEITDVDNGQPIVRKTLTNADKITNIDSDGEEYSVFANNNDIKMVTNSVSSVTGVLSEQHGEAANVFTKTGTKSADINIEQRGTGTVYGMKVNGTVTDTGSSYFELSNAQAENVGTSKSKITINNLGGADVYGMDVEVSKNGSGYSSGYANGAYADGNSSANSEITISNKGDGNVYGIKSSFSAFNAESDENAKATSQITINNIGNGNVYGLFGPDVVNAESCGYDNKNKASATGIININTKGNGKAYGLYSSSDYYRGVYNAYADEGENTKGVVRISNEGLGSAYGLSGFNISSIGYYDPSLYSLSYNSGNAVANSIINILNRSNGNVYGIHSAFSGNTIKHLSFTKNNLIAKSVMEFANIGDGLAVGIYSKDGTVENSGDIKIHNLANGTAVGIYADGTTTVTNSGNITIDRTNFVDDMATDSTADDVTFRANSAKGGKAVGIYGASGSNINNTGIITINGAIAGYGIYSEGSNVTNTGIILIDGNSNHTNAIKLNGGKLFQDGLIYVGANWGDDNTGGNSSGDNSPINNQSDVPNIQPSGDAITDIDTGQPIIKATLKPENVITVNDDGSTYEQTFNNSNIKVVTNSASSVTGLLIEKVVAANAYSESGKKTAEISVEQRGNGDVYGINAKEDWDEFDSTSDFIYNEIANACSNKSGETVADIKVSNFGAGNAYGMYSDVTESMLTNADAYLTSSATGTITINNKTDGENEIYAIKAEDGAYNAAAYENGVAKGYILINNIGGYDIYGLSANNAENAYALGKTAVTNKPRANSYGLININSVGDVDIFGMIGKGLKNARASSGATAFGRIRISHDSQGGDGDAFGMVSFNGGSLSNADALDYDNTTTSSATGIINIINKSVGGAYGMYASNYNSNNNAIYNSGNSTIEIANISNGLAVGIYSKDGTVENSGNIKIHNLGDGTAVGIYADGTTTVTNSGNITIDRERFVDDMATEDTADDKVYVAKTAKGGMAIGIYGTADSNIINDGKINITDAGIGYGIYTEGGNFTNNGVITIDGNTASDKAIKTNGGKLFQDGMLIVGNNSMMQLSGEHTANNNDVVLTSSYALQSMAGVEVASSVQSAINAFAATGEDNSSARVTVAVETGNADVSGIKATSANTELANAKASDSGTAKGVLSISSGSSGNAMGIDAEGVVQNAVAKNGGTSEATILVNQSGDGNAYGMIGTTLYNATDESESQLFTSMYQPASRGISGVTTAIGNIDIINANSSASAYGMYSNIAGNQIFNTNKNTDNVQVSSNIELVNIKNGLVAGIYSKDGMINNSGDIKIHNLAGGTAVGIYADGTTTAVNTGTITIDRNAYIDTQATEEADDDVIYMAASAIGGKAIGIYGAAGSTIINLGNIDIIGAAIGYGIWSEGEDVTNRGIISIDGNVSSENAIVLNGGKLFQDGLLYSGADWSNSVNTGPLIGKNRNVNNSEIVLNNVLKRDIYGIQNNGSVYNASSEQEDLAQTASINLTNRNDGAVYGIDGDGYVRNSTAYKGSAEATVTINNNGNGDIYGMRGTAYVENSLPEVAGTQATGYINISNVGNGDIYGIKGTGYVQNALANKLNTISKAFLTIENHGNGDVYGLNSDFSAENTLGDNTSTTARGRMIINNEGDGVVSGVFATHAQNGSIVGYRNGNDNKINGNTLYSEISIENKGNGSAYGINGGKNGYGFNMDIDADLVTNSNLYSVINITNQGNGSAYGVYANKAYNLNGDRATFNDNYISSLIRIYNKDAANIYGLYGQKVYNANISQGIAKVVMINTNKGNAYGMYGKNIYNKSGNGYSSTIEMANVGNGLAVGIYANDGTIENSGDIKIHNLAEGTAVGIYADGTTKVTNSGTITIDRASYTDDIATEDTSDDVTYRAQTTKGGKAVGIYGAAGSSINNTGTITINGADKAYGIYSEGNNVTNSGTILLDGEYTENAIRLNGGKLFQDGLMYAGADWLNSQLLIGKSDVVNNAVISLVNNDNRDVYGMYNAKPNYNARDGEGSISITNFGNGNVYGIYGESYYAYNAKNTSGEKATSGKIVINNHGNGDVYGIRGSDNVSSASSPQAYGLISIRNDGTGNVYGMNFHRDSTSSTHNVWGKGTGIINIVNKSIGNAYGMHSKNAYNRKGNEQLSTIELANISDGLAVGIYGIDGTIENSGDIKIHNLADGTAVGIYADGTTKITNSGTITIDRASYTDDMATEDTSDDITYNAQSSKGGKAIGIYGAAGSNITNTGTITINGADKAYGIYSEGNNVTNSGTILLDGEYTENAIRLNGGQLFQDGIIKAGANWENNGSSGSSTLNCVHGTQNGNSCSCEEGWSGSDCSVYNDAGDITDEDTGSEIIKKNITNNDVTHITEGSEVYYIGANNEDIKATVASTNSVIGLNVPSSIINNTNVEAAINAFNNADEKVSIEIIQRGNGNVYGMRFLDQSNGNSHNYDMYMSNVFGYNKNADGTIKIVDTGGSADTENKDDFSRIYGIYSDIGDVANVSIEGNTENSIANGTIDITSNADKHIYGISAHGDTYNAEGDEYGRAVGRISIINNGNGDVYGIESVGQTRNANASEDSIAEGYITIENNGNGNIYGVNADVNYNISHDNDVAYNAFSSDDSTAKAEIKINNTGSGNVYGLNFEGSDYMNLQNAFANDNGSATGKIIISNFGNGNVYGMKSTHNVFNTYNRLVGNGTATGIINITNAGDGNAYGIYADWIKSLYEDTPSASNHHTANSIVNVINTGSGNAYGMYGRDIQHITTGSKMTSTIEMVNKGDKLAVGIYSKNGTIENSGDIKIHNLADGTAVGIYADGTTNATNSGSITIDRENYTDDMATEDKSDDQTYTANSTKGGKAIGIYGAAGSSITNTGTITINGADKAYGIYTESDSAVNNTGTILIDGNSNHTNKIVLNGSALFQNGVLKAGANWEEEFNEQKLDSLIAKTGEKSEKEVLANSYILYNNNTLSLSNIEYRDVYGYTQNSNITFSDDIETSNAYSKTNITQNASISLTNKSNSNIYGINGSDNVHNSFASNGKAIGQITIDNEGNGDVYAVRSTGYKAINTRVQGEGSADGNITIDNKGNGNVYALWADSQAGVHNIWENGTREGNSSVGVINIKNNGDGNVTALGGSEQLSWATNVDGYGKNYATLDGKIIIDNKGNGDVYGIHLQQENASASNISRNNKSNALISVTNDGTGNAYGISAYQVTNVQEEGNGTVRVINKNVGNAYGLYGSAILNESNGTTQTSTVELVNASDGLAVGIYSKNSKMNNSGDIKIHNLANGTAVGIYVAGTASNSGTITIDRASYTDDMATDTTSDDVTYSAQTTKGGKAIGIYGAFGSSINNTGTITINGADEAYGIYTESGSAVNNTGTILIDGNSNHTNKIVLNGSALFQNGTLITQSTNTPQSAMAPMSVSTRQPASLNLNDFGGTVVASGTSQFIVEGSISGDLAINNNVIENGFDTTYKVSNMIQAEDANGLNLLSQSALFDATLENEHDAVMTMKSFNDVVENQSVADFLKQNYAAENNEQLFGMLKNKETLAALNNTLDSLIGSDMFNRFTFEDLTMMRDLNADMNNTLFTNNDKHLQIAGNITPWNFDGNTGSNARYALYNTTFNEGSLGLGIAFSDVRSNNGRNDKDSRYDQTFQMSVPMGYKTNGIKFISTPRFGYAYGTYDRTGYEGKNYDGKIEKRMFGLMNEARYPISFGNWSIAPAVEFNALGYHIKGKEDVKEYSLNINSQNNYSVESGLGLYANRELKPTKSSTLKLNAGVAVYHEFADPYALELGMNGMDGSFTVRDERRKDNRAVIRTGFDYSFGNNLTFIGTIATYIDGTTHNNANLDLKYNF